jgi:hypothetical protein
MREKGQSQIYEGLMSPGTSETEANEAFDVVSEVRFAVRVKER